MNSFACCRRDWPPTQKEGHRLCPHVRHTGHLELLAEPHTDLRSTKPGTDEHRSDQETALLRVAMPGATSSVLASSSDALCSVRSDAGSLHENEGQIQPFWSPTLWRGCGVVIVVWFHESVSVHF